MLTGLCVVLLAGAVFRLVTIYARGREPGGTFGGKEVVVDGDVVLVRIARHKGRIRQVNVTIDIPIELSFTLYREGWFDRLAKLLGIARELQTGDMPFDGRIYIQSEDPALHDALQLRKELRNCLFNLMRDPNTREVGAANRRLWVASTAYNELKEREDDVLAPQVANDFLPALRLLRPELARVGGGGTEDSRDATRITRRWISAGIAICVLAGAIGTFYFSSRHDYQVVLAEIPLLAFAVAGGVFALGLVVLYLALKSTAFTHRVLLDIVIAAVPGAWVAALGGLTFYNEAFDSSPAQRVTIPIERAWQSTSSKSKARYLRSWGWPDARARDSVEITPEEFALMSGRLCVDVIWRKGELGDGWVEQYHASDALACDVEVEK